MAETKKPLGTEKTPPSEISGDRVIFGMLQQSQSDYLGIKPGTQLYDIARNKGQLLPERAIRAMNDSLQGLALAANAGMTMALHVKLEESPMRPDNFKNQMYFHYCPGNGDLKGVKGFESTRELLAEYDKQHSNIGAEPAGPKYVLEADEIIDILKILNDGIIKPVEEKLRKSGALGRLEAELRQEGKLGPEQQITFYLDLEELMKSEATWVDRAQASSDQGRGGHGGK